jgi:hypothetical protein
MAAAPQNRHQTRQERSSRLAQPVKKSFLEFHFPTRKKNYFETIDYNGI